MSDRGALSGFNWHFEYHTINRKKEKAADCAFLTVDRICQNNKSINYLSKCFVASDCPLKLKQEEFLKRTENKQRNIASSKNQQIKGIKCSLPKNCVMFNNHLGKGRFVGYDEKNMFISVRFGESIKRFEYPKAIFEKHLILPKFAFDIVLNDVLKCSRK